MPGGIDEVAVGNSTGKTQGGVAIGDTPLFYSTITAPGGISKLSDSPMQGGRCW